MTASITSPRWLRLADLTIALPASIAALPVCLLLYVLGLMDTGSPLFRQQRVGRNGTAFTMLKFRTMVVSARSVPTHEMQVSDVTSLGRFLRRTKLDELPQLWNVLKGEMSLVGPRPCLPTQAELIEARRRQGLERVRPGITGLAQVNGITMEDPLRLARMDARGMRGLTFRAYLRLLFKTVTGR